ncbi:hypothetical protein HaLaN_24520, partial [Haematococcus lacustris]
AKLGFGMPIVLQSMVPAFRQRANHTSHICELRASYQVTPLQSLAIICATGPTQRLAKQIIIVMISLNKMWSVRRAVINIQPEPHPSFLYLDPQRIVHLTHQDGGKSFHMVSRSIFIPDPGLATLVAALESRVLTIAHVIVDLTNIHPHARNILPGCQPGNYLPPLPTVLNTLDSQQARSALC